MIYKVKKPVYICGSLHGNFHWLKSYIEEYNLSDCSIVFCGDVGLGFEPLKTWHHRVHELKLTSLLQRRKIVCYFIRGNHDNPTWFDDKTLVTEHFKAASDYSVLSTPNHNILCVGGGISVDRSDRKFQMKYSMLRYLKDHPNATMLEAESQIAHTYWPNEAPVYNETAIDNLTCRIDTVCSHVAPIEFVYTISFNERTDPLLYRDCVAEQKAMSNVLARLQHNQHPLTKWFCGHYHFYATGEVCGVSKYLLDMARDGMLCLKELTT